MSFYQKVRWALWPIYRHELKKFLPMTGMMFAILFNYSAARSIKDSLVVSHIGPEAISFLKLYLVLPVAILGMLIYAKLMNMMKSTYVFYTIIGFFLLFFALFGFVLYPNQSILHPAPDAVSAWVSAYPRFKWFFLIGGQWIYAAFFIMAELWGSMGLSLLFWGFANQITDSKQAKRFYAMFGLLGSVALIASGSVLKRLGGLGNPMVLIQGICLLLLVFGLVVISVYAWMQRRVVPDPDLCPSQPLVKKKKTKLSLKDSFKVIFTTPYIGYIALLVISYGIAINLIETLWKAQVRLVYPDMTAYAAFMGRYMQWTAIGTISLTFVGANILRLVRWRQAALVVPMIFLFTGIPFFIFIIYQGIVDQWLVGSFLSAVLLAVQLGMIQNILSKASKYSLFDATKEMAYIPIDDELKTKGKAAVDVVGARLGKSGGAFIVSSLAVAMPDFQLTDFAPILLVIYILIVMTWLWAVCRLSARYEAYRQADDSV